MALRDIFKKKVKVAEASLHLPPRSASQSSVVEVKPVEKPKQIKEKETPKEPVLEKTFPKQKEKKTGESWRILKSPHVTEKATDLTKKNQYVFKVFSRANKSEIKKAIGGLYGVDVISVKIINIPSKKRRLGRISGWKPGYKKAIIGIKEGQTIEVLPR